MGAETVENKEVTPATVLPEDKPVDLSAFDTLLTTKPQAVEEKPVEKKVEEVKPKDEQKTVDVVPAKTDGTSVQATEKKPQEEKPATPQLPKLPTITDARDYAGFSETEIPLLKKMSNETWEFVAPRLKEYKQQQERLKSLEAEVSTAKQQQVPLSPHAYVLDPRYQEAALISNRIAQELRHWREQKVRIAKGEDWEDLRIDENGKLIKIKCPATAEAGEELQSRIDQGVQIEFAHRQKMQAFEENYGNIYKSSIANVRNIEDSYFPEFKDEKEALKDKNYATMREALAVNNQTNNPLSGILSKLFAKYVALAERFNAKVAAEEKAQKELEQRKIIPPSTDEIQGGASGTEEATLKSALDTLDKMVAQ